MKADNIMQHAHSLPMSIHRPGLLTRRPAPKAEPFIRIQGKLAPADDAYHRARRPSSHAASTIDLVQRTVNSITLQ